MTFALSGVVVADTDRTVRVPRKIRGNAGQPAVGNRKAAGAEDRSSRWEGHRARRHVALAFIMGLADQPARTNVVGPRPARLDGIKDFDRFTR